MSGHIAGMGQLLRRLRLLPRRADEIRAEALREWATELEKSAKELAPVRTGRLRDSIEAKINENAGRAWVRIKPGIGDYPYYVEKGTSKMHAQPFMGPAAQMHRRTGERLLRRATSRRLWR
jgi:HK97 gp10 family phage protein